LTEALRVVSCHVLGFYAINVWLPGDDSWLEPEAKEVEERVSI